MTLFNLVSQLRTRPLDPDSLMLRVFQGYLSPADEQFVMSEEYDGLPYCAILTLENPAIERYHNGSARFLDPVDLFFESFEPENKIYIEQLIGIVERNLHLVDELRTGVPLASPFTVAARLAPERRGKSSVYGTLSLQTL